MKKLYLIIMSLMSAVTAMSQSPESEELSLKLANRMKDSVDLTEQQRDAVLEANRWIANRKQLAWQTYSGSDSLRIQIQREENKRDSLYGTILPAQKFELYLSRKRGIINNK